MLADQCWCRFALVFRPAPLCASDQQQAPKSYESYLFLDFGEISRGRSLALEKKQNVGLRLLEKVT